MGSAERSTLVVITGPVASGKSSLARDLASSARLSGVRAASVDLDEIIFMIAGSDWTRVTSDDWKLGRTVAAAVIDTLFAAGARVVAIAGPFFGRDERDEFVRHIESRCDVKFVVLRVSLPEAVRRAQVDPSRGLSKDPTILAELEKTIEWGELPKDRLDIVTDGLSRDAVAERTKVLLPGNL